MKRPTTNTVPAEAVAEPAVVNLAALMQLPIAERTGFLESLAHLDGLRTAPGPRHEGEVLLDALSTLPDAPPPSSEAAEILPKTLWGHYLKAPFALIKLLELFHPQLLGMERQLRVLYLGAGRDEVLDEGRWFSMAWMLRGIKGPPPDITAVGPELANAASWEPSPWRNMVERLPATATILPATLIQSLGVGDQCVDWERHFDIVVMHHPGFVALMNDWWLDEAWTDLAGFAEIPVVGTSFDATDFAFDTWGLAASGRIVDRAWWNPVAHVAPLDAEQASNGLGIRIQWGGVLWSTTRDPQFVEGARSRNQEAAFRWFEEHLHPLFIDQRGIAKLLRWYYSCPLQFDSTRQHLLVTDDIHIHVASGRIEAFGQQGRAGPAARAALSAQDLEARLKLAPALLAEIEAWLDLEAAAATHAERKAQQRDDIG